jgi:hypothetical protein
MECAHHRRGSVCSRPLAAALLVIIKGLYLPPHAVAVQLVPFGKVVNFDEFGALLAARGPYLEWHNTIKVGVSE